MYEQVEKPKENKSRTVAKSVSQKKNVFSSTKYNKAIHLVFDKSSMKREDAKPSMPVVQRYPAFRVESGDYPEHKLKQVGGGIKVDIQDEYGIDISFSDTDHSDVYLEERKNLASVRLVTFDVSDDFYKAVQAMVTGKTPDAKGAKSLLAKFKDKKLPTPVATSDSWVKNKTDALHFQIEWAPYIQKSINSGKVQTYAEVMGGDDNSDQGFAVWFDGDEDIENVVFYKDKPEIGVNDVTKYMTVLEARYFGIEIEDPV